MISEEEFTDLANFVRHQRNSDAAERHSYLMTTLVDDLAEGENLNARDYQILRAAAILHDAAGPHPGDPDLSAALAASRLAEMHQEQEFVHAVVEAIRRAAGSNEPLSLADQLTADACALALMLQSRSSEPILWSATAARIARAIAGHGTPVLALP